MSAIHGGPLQNLARMVLRFLLALAPSLAFGRTPATSPAGTARIEGTIAVIVDATRLKHWGIPGADAAFVPDTDESAYAARIRAAADARTLCSAVNAAVRQDRRIASTSIDGDGSLDHRSGDEERMSFTVIVPNVTSGTRGTLYICSRPVFAMMSEGSYPNERFYQVGKPHGLQTSRRVSLRSGESVPVRFTVSMDASQW